jgi:hypothetical protein
MQREDNYRSDRQWHWYESGGHQEAVQAIQPGGQGHPGEVRRHRLRSLINLLD